jgi:carboxylesterase type B
MAAPETIQLSAPSLGGELTGLVDKESDVALFRGIPFATLSKRWTHSEAQHTLGSGVFDATRFGPRCPQADGFVLVSGGTADPYLPDDEFRCLNLNIAVPAEALRSKPPKLLPVLFWIHGYALVLGHVLLYSSTMVTPC